VSHAVAGGGDVSCDQDRDDETSTDDATDPAGLSEAMASAVERLRHLAMSAFDVDPARPADPPRDSRE
jgi:hypothetical protein